MWWRVEAICRPQLARSSGHRLLAMGISTMLSPILASSPLNRWPPTQKSWTTPFCVLKETTKPLNVLVISKYSNFRWSHITTIKMQLHTRVQMTYLDWYIGSSISLAIPRTWSQHFALVQLSQTHNFSSWSSSLSSTSVCISWALRHITSLPNHPHSDQLHTMLLQLRDVCAHVPLDFSDWNPENIDL
jgi:hypothetical protein